MRPDIDFVCMTLSEIYERITGRPCSTQLFVVRKDCALGAYYVHLLDTAEFYLVDVKKIGDKCLKATNS